MRGLDWSLGMLAARVVRLEVVSSFLDSERPADAHQVAGLMRS